MGSLASDPTAETTSEGGVRPVPPSPRKGESPFPSPSLHESMNVVGSRGIGS